MLRDYSAEAIGGDQTQTQTTQTPATRPHQMKKWTRKPRNPRSAETRRLISLAIAARDEAAARPTAKNKALREVAYMRVIVACEQMIQAYASRFAAREIDPEDLTSTATLGLIEALNRFDDCKSGGGWTGYVGAWMLWKLQQYTGSRDDDSPELLMIDDHGTGNMAALLNGAAYEMQSSHRAWQEGAE